MDGWLEIGTAPQKGEFLAYGSYVYPGDKSATEYMVIAERTGLSDWPWETAEGMHPYGFLSHWTPLPTRPNHPSDRARHPAA